MKTEKVFKIKISIFEYIVTVIISENINKSRIKRNKSTALPKATKP